jgi:succinate dehydrogenase/fumarate reductase cytochrome b subunit
MAGNTQMNDSERGVFSVIHGVSGLLIATALLLSILAFLTINAISVQSANAENYYEINQKLDGLKMNSPENHKMWINSNK